MNFGFFEINSSQVYIAVCYYANCFLLFTALEKITEQTKRFGVRMLQNHLVRPSILLTLKFMTKQK